jgi:arginine/lysine/ornithine decarboxylase
MAYPPGIPLVIPGEIITDDAVRLIEFYKNEGGEVLKDTRQDQIKVIDRENWYLNDDLLHSYKEL